MSLLPQVTYHQQQAALQQQRQAAARSAQLAEAQEAACQDAWIVCVLVELLGSNLIAPDHTAAVNVPPPSTSLTAGAAAEDTYAGGGGQLGDVGGGSWCCWDRGYRVVKGEPGSTADAGAAHSPCMSSNSSSGGSANTAGTANAPSSKTEGCKASGGPLDLLNHCISYPQFVEVLLCLMAARSVGILEPDVKQIRPLAMDEEMQV